MSDMLQLSNKIEKKRNAGKGQSLQSRQRIRNLPESARNHTRRKVYVLNMHIFPAMANLTVILNTQKTLTFVKYSKTISALFAVDRDGKQAPIFQRFLVASVCNKQIGEPMSAEEELPAISKPSFRFILCRLM